MSMFPLTEYQTYGPKVLDLYAARQAAFANNIANVNTPGYKPMAVSFPDELRSLLDEMDEKKLDVASYPDRPSFQPETGRPMSGMEQGFMFNSRMFDAGMAEMGGQDETPAEQVGPRKGEELEQAMAEVPLNPSPAQPGTMRADGNGVDIFKEIVGMYRNSYVYNGLTNELGGSMKSLKSIIAGTY